MARKRHAKLLRAFVTSVRMFSKDHGRPVNHGRDEWWRLVAPTVTLFGMTFKGVTK